MTSTATHTPDSLRALSLVGRVVTDGVRVGVAKHADGPNWLVVTDTVDGSPDRVRLIVLEDTWSAHSEAEILVRWHGQPWLTVCPLNKIRKGVTLRKS